MGPNLRRHARSSVRIIGGVKYISIAAASHQLGWSADAIKNWICAPQKFTAGAILKVAVIDRARWFTHDSVLNAKIALRLHGRIRSRRTS